MRATCVSSLAASFLFLTSCVSVRIDNYGADKDKSVRIEQPAKPLNPSKIRLQTHMKNPESGSSVIAYLSECSPALNVDLMSIVNDAVTSLKWKSRIPRNIE